MLLYWVQPEALDGPWLAQHAAAVTLLEGKPGLLAFSDARVNDEPVRQLRARVRLQSDSNTVVEAVRVALFLVGGEQRVVVNQARGSLADPLTDANLQAKFDELTVERLPRPRVETLSEALWNLDAEPDVARVLALANLAASSSANACVAVRNASTPAGAPE